MPDENEESEAQPPAEGAEDDEVQGGAEADPDVPTAAEEPAPQGGSSELFDLLPPEAREALAAATGGGEVTEVVAIQALFRGILPLPAHLKAYAEIDPEIPRELLGLVKSEAEHRRARELAADKAHRAEAKAEAELEQVYLQADAEGEQRGTRAAVTVCLAAFGFATLALWIAPNAAGAVVASVLGGGALVSIVATLVIGRRRGEETEGD